MVSVDLNCDLGEAFGAYQMGNDMAILDYVTSVNIACGFHGGDPLVMDRTVKAALEKGVALGAHPGLPDLLGFGRRYMKVSLEEARAYLIYQIGALQGFIKAHGGKLQHVKPHGALYNMAASDEDLAKALAEAVRAVDEEIIFVGLAGSQMIKAAKAIGLVTAEEIFADRNYLSNGLLVPRDQPNAVIHHKNHCIQRVVKMVKEKTVAAVDGKEILIQADTVCLHGDHPEALDFARALKEALIKAGIKLVPLKYGMEVAYGSNGDLSSGR